MGHRGPDDEGVAVVTRATGEAHEWSTDQSAPGVAPARLPAGDAPLHDVAFGHRRFSIVDLSAAGHQPMWTVDRKVCVAVNGEIYNHVAVRRELEGLGWRFASTSDSEVLAVAYRQWGTDCFARLNGFWALSLYDAEQGRVLLARDRLGKAPLYYTVADDGVYWASELAVVRSLAPGRSTVRQQSVVDFVAHQRRDYDHHTFFEEIATLPPATWAWVGDGGRLEQHRYWSIPGQRMTEDDIGAGEAAGRAARAADRCHPVAAAGRRPGRRPGQRRPRLLGGAGPGGPVGTGGVGLHRAVRRQPRRRGARSPGGWPSATAPPSTTTSSSHRTWTCWTTSTSSSG